MACTLPLSRARIVSTSSSSSSSSKYRSIGPASQLHLRCSASSSSPGDEPTGDNPNQSGRGSSTWVLIERYSDGTAKRFFLDHKTRLQTFLEKHTSESDDFRASDLTSSISLLPNFVKDFALPSGFPESVSGDYLEYMSWQFPTNVTAWICHTLVTSSLLSAVGVSSLPATAAAASAATIRWVSKDGIGAVGRFIIGGRFGSFFDDDPKQWRMYADFIGSAGSIFDLSTQLYPDYFLPLASLGNLAKAIGRGLKDPSFRVIQNHFAVSGNLGDVAAKEEVWEVTAQLLGLGIGVLILGTPGLLPSYPILVLTWMSMRLLHLWLRYQSLSVLQFKTINFKRAHALAKSHILHAKLPGRKRCNKEENILSWKSLLEPRIVFGVSLETMWDDRPFSTMKKILDLYAKEKYVLLASRQHDRGLDIMVSFKRGASSLSALRSIWQACWLYEKRNHAGDINDLLEESLQMLDMRFENFFHQLEEGGWNTEEISIKVPTEPLIEEVESI